MTEHTWTAVDDYANDLFLPADSVLESVLEESTKAGLPEIAVSAAQGKMLMLLAKSLGAQSILEIGTLGAYSTIWLCRALPAGGTLVSLEYEPKHAEVARRNLAKAGFQNTAQIIVGPAAESLPKLTHDDSRVPFDFIFIDADKENYDVYFEWSLKLSRPGTLIVADNVVRDGGVIDANHPDGRGQGIRKFNEILAKNKQVEATAIQTVGKKGYDGFALIYVLE